jgi:hypothetical protein
MPGSIDKTSVSDSSSHSAFGPIWFSNTHSGSYAFDRVYRGWNSGWSSPGIGRMLTDEHRSTRRVCRDAVVRDGRIVVWQVFTPD